jgi:acetyl-CoA carboxylase carboxyltransferase component
VVPGDRFPRRRPTGDPVDRDVRDSVHADIDGSPFDHRRRRVLRRMNPERKQPFDMRSVMRSVADQDCEPLERWQNLRDGDTSIVWDTTIGGIPVCLLGLESHPVARKGFVPADGPPAWTSGTLFPHSSRKTARAVNAASGSRPLVVLANLSGFDGSPESMRRRQLEYGAEIGRAVTNFVGPIVFVVVSRYHGGAFVVFSKALNESMEIAAVEGSYASVIGGAPAAATVFAREVKQRTERDERVREAREALDAATEQPPPICGWRWPTSARGCVRRSSPRWPTSSMRSTPSNGPCDVGSVDRIIAATDLRPYVVDALERGMARA